MGRFIRQSETLFHGEGGRIQLLPEGVIYLRIDHDGEVSAQEVHEGLLCIHALCPEQRPVLLIDRLRSYWLSFEAQQTFMVHTGLAAVAYWIRRPISVKMVEFAKESYFRGVPVEAFQSRGPAMQWLQKFVPTGPKMVPSYDRM